MPKAKFKISKHKNSGQLVYYSKVQFGDKYCFVTFPSCYTSQENALKAISKKALEGLKTTLLSKSTSKIAQEDDLVNNIIKLFSDNEDTILSDYLVKRYFEVYQQCLESNWIELIKSSKLFTVDEIKISSKLFISISLNNNKSTIDQPIEYTESLKNEEEDEELNYYPFYDQIYISNKNIKECAITEEIQLPSFEEMFAKHLKSCNRVGYFNVQDRKKLDLIRELPDSVKIPNDSDFEVLILSGRSANDGNVFLRLLEYSNDLDTLINEMNELYLRRRKGRRIENTIIDNVYVALFNRPNDQIEGIVSRIKVIELIGSGLVNCLFLDDGFIDIISVENLREIEDPFLQLPFQALEVKLDFGFTKIEKEFKRLINEIIEFKLIEQEASSSSLCLIGKLTNSGEPIATIGLFDTSNNDYDIDLNQLIAKFIESFKAKYYK